MIKNIIIAITATFAMSCSTSYDYVIDKIHIILQNPDTLYAMRNDTNYFRLYFQDTNKSGLAYTYNELEDNIKYLNINKFKNGYILKDRGSEAQSTLFLLTFYAKLTSDIRYVTIRSNFNNNYVSFRIIRNDKSDKWQITEILNGYLFRPKNMTKEELDEYFDGL